MKIMETKTEQPAPDWRDKFVDLEITEIYKYMNVVNQKFFNVTGHKPTYDQQLTLLSIRELLHNTLWIMNQNNL